jgi:hypothetical protein
MTSINTALAEVKQTLDALKALMTLKGCSYAHKRMMAGFRLPDIVQSDSPFEYYARAVTSLFKRPSGSFSYSLFNKVTLPSWLNFVKGIRM